MDDRFYITTPIYYVNDAPHIGHAYTSVACDVLARFWRSRGKEVFFLTGTDEHGRKVADSAAQKGMKPQQFADIMSQQFQKLNEQLLISNDDFIRTTQERHQEAACHFWNELDARGFIKKDVYRGFYSVRDETYVSDDAVVHHKDGSVTDEAGNPLEHLQEESFFFVLSRFTDALLDYYKTHTDAIVPHHRRNEVQRFIEGGLRDLSISRQNLQWGIPVPQESDHVMYVWIDALVNYLSAIGYPNHHEEWWPAQMHVIGKDIVRFHGIYWPAMLMALDLPLPRQLVAHGWWTHEGEKISKSRGNVIDPFELLERWGVNAVRYFLLREIPFGNDGDFSADAMRRRINGDLANGLGNVSQRVLRFIERQAGGVMPPCHSLSDEDEALVAQATALPALIEDALTRVAFHQGLEHVWSLIAASDRFVAHHAPWQLKKTDEQRMESVLWVLMQSLAAVMSALHPFMPSAMEQLRHQLGMAETWDSLRPTDALPPAGTQLPPPQPLFPRWEDSDVCG